MGTILCPEWHAALISQLHHFNFLVNGDPKAGETLANVFIQKRPFHAWLAEVVDAIGTAYGDPDCPFTPPPTNTQVHQISLEGSSLLTAWETNPEVQSQLAPPPGGFNLASTSLSPVYHGTPTRNLCSETAAINFLNYGLGMHRSELNKELSPCRAIYTSSTPLYSFL